MMQVYCLDLEKDQRFFPGASVCGGKHRDNRSSKGNLIILQEGRGA